MSLTYPDLPQTLFPDQIQSFVTMLNMTIADSEAIAGYQRAIEAGDEIAAQNYFNSIVNGKQKIIDAEKMNSIMQTCIALERFYTENIQDYIINKEANWNNRVNQFNYLGTYSSVVQYQVNNFVMYNVDGVNQLYICIATPPVGTLPTITNYWRVISIQGRQGESGVGLSFRYNWSSSQTYYTNDIVSYNNSVWLSNAQNTNNPPSSDSAIWSLIYSPKQVIYPLQSNQPSGELEVGDIWFELI